MGLFDKKYCDVCGEKIGLLGNRKLEDGNLCKNCAKKLSPFFNERRSSTVDEIKQQLAYREENKRQLAYFNPTRTLGTDEKVYVDEINRRFIVTSSSNWREKNPDIIEISQVTSCNVDIEEDRDEIMHTDNQGNEVSYNPPRYKYEYIFNVEITVNSPWFSEISFELTDYENRPDSRYTDIYREYERQADELKRLLMPAVYGNQQFSSQNFQQNNQLNCQTPYCEQNSVYQGQGYQQPQHVKTDSEISSISITQNHMNRAYCYAFSVYECNDKHIFSAWCVLKDGENSSKEVDIQNIEITATEFSEFARLNEKYGFADYIKRNNNKKYNISDETTNSFKVCFGGEALTLKTDNECYNAVYDYFITLTTKYLV